MKQLIELIHEYQNLSRKRKRSNQPLSEPEQARLDELRLYLDQHLRNEQNAQNAQRHRQSRPRLQPVNLEETYRDLDTLSLQAPQTERSAPSAQSSTYHASYSAPSTQSSTYHAPSSAPSTQSPTYHAPSSAPSTQSSAQSATYHAPSSAPSLPTRPEDAPYIPSGPSFPAASLEVLDLQRLREQIEHPKRTHTEQPQPAFHPPSHTSIRTLRHFSNQGTSSIDQLPEASALKTSRPQPPPSQPPIPASNTSSQDRWHFLPRPATHAEAEALPIRVHSPSTAGIVEHDLTHLGLELNLPEEETPHPHSSPFGTAAPSALSLPLLIELRRLEHKRRRSPLAAHEETRFREIMDQVFLAID